MSHKKGQDNKRQSYTHPFIFLQICSLEGSRPKRNYKELLDDPNLTFTESGDIQEERDSYMYATVQVCIIAFMTTLLSCKTKLYRKLELSATFDHMLSFLPN